MLERRDLGCVAGVVQADVGEASGDEVANQALEEGVIVVVAQSPTLRPRVCVEQVRAAPEALRIATASTAQFVS